MKAFKIITGLLINSSALIVAVITFIPNAPDLSLIYLAQPLIVFYDYYIYKNIEEYGCYVFLLMISNIAMPIGCKIYYETVSKSVSHGLSWNAVMTEVGYAITIYLLIGIAIIVAIECIISMVVKGYGERKKRQ